jgi:hypothetical protein
MKILMLALLLLPALGPAAEALPAAASPTAEATLAPTPAPLSPPWDSVTLKDGQWAEGKLRGYDAFFLSFELKNGAKAQLPWIEVAEVKPAEFSGDTALMRQYMKPDAVEVASRIQARSPSRARAKALWPGLLIHGAGFREAGNTDMFLSLAGAELFGIVVGGFGAARASDVSLSTGERDTANSLALGGAAVFAVTWLIDLVGSGYSAENFNAAHGLTVSLLPAPGKTAVTASLRF